MSVRGAQGELMQPTMVAAATIPAADGGLLLICPVKEFEGMRRWFPVCEYQPPGERIMGSEERLTLAEAFDRAANPFEVITVALRVKEQFPFALQRTPIGPYRTSAVAAFNAFCGETDRLVDGVNRSIFPPEMDRNLGL